MSNGKWAVAVLAACVVVTVAAVAYAAGKAKAAPVAEVVRARRFELVDTAGRVRAALEFDSAYWSKSNDAGNQSEQPQKEQVPRLVLFDERGTKRAELSVDRHGSWSSLNRETGKPGLIASAAFRGSAVGVFDLEGKKKVVVEAAESWPSMTYRHGLVLYGGDFEEVGSLVAGADGRPHLSLSRAEGVPWSAP